MIVGGTQPGPDHRRGAARGRRRPPRTSTCAIIGEPIWPGRSDLEYPACVQHEALINLAFAGRSATILCPYDVAGLDPVVIADAVATHPTLIQSGTSWPSPGYAPERIMTEHNRALPEPSDATVVPFDAARLRRRPPAASAEHAERIGLAAERVDDVPLAVGEMAANSLRHGGGAGVLRLWTDAGHVVCEVADAGVIDDPLVGSPPGSTGSAQRARPADGEPPGGPGAHAHHDRGHGRAGVLPRLRGRLPGSVLGQAREQRAQPGQEGVLDVGDGHPGTWSETPPTEAGRQSRPSAA